METQNPPKICIPLKLWNLYFVFAFSTPELNKGMIVFLIGREGKGGEREMKKGEWRKGRGKDKL